MAVTDTQRLSLIPEAITRAAAKNPNHPALTMGGEVLTYGQLDRLSNSVANMLLARGVAHGDRIGLYAHKSLDLFVALYGIMKAGAVYVPINPDAPAAYVRHILDDCSITHLVIGKTTETTATGLAIDAGLQLLIGTDPCDGEVDCIGWNDVWSYPSTPPDVVVSSDDLAYIIFTSGSTGRPKGIMHTHSSGLAYGEVAATAYGFGTHDRIANHPPLNFDLSLLELFGGIVAGATIVIIPETHVLLPASLSQLLADEQVTVLNAVPFALIQLLHRGALDERDLSAMRWVLFGGEVYPTADLRGLMSLVPDARFANVYGPAEVNGVTYYVVPELAADSIRPISIGCLYPGMEALVVDADDCEVTQGQTGELLIRSPTHMVGYWRQPELTARSTHYRTSAEGNEQRWHRTGDLVNIDSEGLFHLSGRRDRLVKIRGHRVELDEVEAVLIGHDGVEQVAVYTVPDGKGSQQIEAAVTVIKSDAGQEPDTGELKRYVGGLLPRYSIPSVIRLVDSIPRTSTGKSDRVALAGQTGRKRQG